MAFAAVTRAIVSFPVASSRYPMAYLLSKRLLHLGSAAAVAPRPFVGLRLARVSAMIPCLSDMGAASRIGAIRCVARRSGDSGHSPLNSGSRGGSGFSDRPPTEMGPLFPGCDYEHWLIVMDKPGGEGASKKQIIDCYIQTLAKVLGRYWLCVFMRWAATAIFCMLYRSELAILFWGHARESLVLLSPVPYLL